jgi:hypothetical protein
MPAQVLTFSSDGALLNRKPIVMIPPPASTPSTAMLGVAFLPGTDALMVIDFGNGNVLSVNPKTGGASVCITLPAANPRPPKWPERTDLRRCRQYLHF